MLLMFDFRIKGCKELTAFDDYLGSILDRINGPCCLTYRLERFIVDFCDLANKVLMVLLSTGYDKLTGIFPSTCNSSIPCRSETSTFHNFLFISCLFVDWLDKLNHVGSLI